MITIHQETQHSFGAPLLVMGYLSYQYHLQAADHEYCVAPISMLVRSQEHLSPHRLHLGLYATKPIVSRYAPDPNWDGSSAAQTC
jgi:hypothetical protein